MIEITLPYPPSANNYKTIGKLVTKPSGKIYQQRINSAKTKRFYFDVWMKYRSYCAIFGNPIWVDSTIEVELRVDMHPPDKRRRDIDNILKVLLDSIQRAGMIEDDSQITRLVVEKKDIIANGQIICRITPI